MEAKFHELRNKRLPKTIHAIGLLGNLARYPHCAHEGREIVQSLADAVRGVQVAFDRKAGEHRAESLKPAPAPASTPSAPPAPDGALEGTALSYARWAMDELVRGDKAKAQAYLRAAILRAEEEAQ